MSAWVRTATLMRSLAAPAKKGGSGGGSGGGGGGKGGKMAKTAEKSGRDIESRKMTRQRVSLIPGRRVGMIGTKLGTTHTWSSWGQRLVLTAIHVRTSAVYSC